MRPVKASIDINAIKNNIRYLRGLSPQDKLIFVIKADAYGHGAPAIAKAVEADVDGFAVASLNEGLLLREAGVTQLVVLLEGCFDESEVKTAQDVNFECVVHNETQWLWHKKQSGNMRLWFKINTGMNRLGFAPAHFHSLCLSDIELRARLSRGILMSHFSSADEKDHHADNQLTCFNSLIDELRDADMHIETTSFCNSAGLIWGANQRISSIDTYHRTGIAAYGVSPFDEDLPSLDPAMTLTTSIIALHHIKKGESVGYGNNWQAERDSTVATIAIGYGDGYPRHAPNGTPVYINGSEASIVGRVSMDMACIDVTDIPNVQLGDEVELWGKNLSVNKVAKILGTIGYELVTRLSKRVTRDYE